MRCASMAPMYVSAQTARTLRTSEHTLLLLPPPLSLSIPPQFAAQAAAGRGHRCGIGWGQGGGSRRVAHTQHNKQERKATHTSAPPLSLSLPRRWRQRRRAELPETECWLRGVEGVCWCVHAHAVSGCVFWSTTTTTTTTMTATPATTTPLLDANTPPLSPSLPT